MEATIATKSCSANMRVHYHVFLHCQKPINSNLFEYQRYCLPRLVCMNKCEHSVSTAPSFRARNSLSLSAFDHQFVTPPGLHYRRQHYPVPVVEQPDAYRLRCARGCSDFRDEHSHWGHWQCSQWFQLPAHSLAPKRHGQYSGQRCAIILTHRPFLNAYA